MMTRTGRQLAAFVEDRETHDVPVGLDAANVLHFTDPAGCHPGKRAHGIEPEIDLVGGLLGHRELLR